MGAVRTNVRRETHGSHALAEFQASSLECLRQLIGFLVVSWLGCNVDGPVRRAGEDLEGHAIFDTFIEAQEDNLRDVYSRIKVLNLLFLGLFKGIEG